MKKILNIAILGCGRVAGHHIKAIENNPLLNLAAVCDLREDRLGELSVSDSIPRYTNYHLMYRNHPEIDAVAVITPSGMHFEHALDAVKKYKKSVVIEKPVVMTISEGLALEQAAQNAGVQIFPVHQYRFNNCVQRVRRAIQNDELGKIVVATVRMRWCRPQSYYDRDPWRGTYALDGGCCTNQGIHHLDMLRYLVGEVESVNAVMNTYSAEIEAEDAVVATLKFEGGALGVVEITTAARPHDYESSLSIVGTKGLAMIGGWATDKLVTFSPNPEDQIKFSDTFNDAYGLGHNDIYQGVYDALTKSGAAAVEFLDAQKTIRLLHSFYESDEQKKWVNVNECKGSIRLGKADERLSSLYRTYDA
ncbi:Gfo/Idh/MocA family protein [Polynucleobacter sp. MWH-UH2A]|uniref:Gfo/Idh/MocA family protein n=1 Tax=Polynucleobacter sp. MWH-UH2A TaxID=1855617 RepID=UPI001BFE883E|nr:Gfo/Idh/MocA family oxidoreductase [Polynucleobacter sp. MWH-UH2A]QWD64375.1 Gfo/Idh/MocA family oxidoreductase [Polynucleobacter sp. MWH-UH2A]